VTPNCVVSLRPTALTLLLALGAALAWPVVAPAPADAQFTAWKGSEMLDDPEWRGRFLGSYGFLSGVEPEIRPDELALLREVIDLMKVNPRAAATMLGAQVTPQSSAALDFILANLYFQNGQIPEAAIQYQQALTKFPDFRRAHKNAGLLILQTGDFAGSLEHLTRAVELGDRDARTYGLIGYAYLNTENFLAAEQAYRNAVFYDPKSRDWKLGLARSLQALQKHEEAVAHFASLIDENPDDVVAWKGQANAYLELDQPLAAAVNLEALRALGEADSQSLVLLGDIYMKEGMPDLARDAYLEVIRSDKDGVRYETAYRAAELLYRTRAYGESRDLIASIDKRYAKSLDAEDEIELTTLKAKLARAQGRDKEAADLLSAIVKRDGTRGDALLELASYYQDKGDSARALMLVEQAENIEAFRYDALLQHAQFMVAASDYRKAAELLRAALKIRAEPRIERYLASVEQAGR
jgi:tetratricopeptide (TPR) repeat protein